MRGTTVSGLTRGAGGIGPGRIPAAGVVRWARGAPGRVQGIARRVVPVARRRTSSSIRRPRRAWWSGGTVAGALERSRSRRMARGGDGGAGAVRLLAGVRRSSCTASRRASSPAEAASDPAREAEAIGGRALARSWSSWATRARMAAACSSTAGPRRAGRRGGAVPGEGLEERAAASPTTTSVAWLPSSTGYALPLAEQARGEGPTLPPELQTDCATRPGSGAALEGDAEDAADMLSPRTPSTTTGTVHAMAVPPVTPAAPCAGDHR